MIVIITAEIFDAVNKTYYEKDHHAKPHTHMEIEIPYGFIKYGQARNFTEKPGYNSVNQ